MKNWIFPQDWKSNEIDNFKSMLILIYWGQHGFNLGVLRKQIFDNQQTSILTNIWWSKDDVHDNSYGGICEYVKMIFKHGNDNNIWKNDIRMHEDDS